MVVLSWGEAVASPAWSDAQKVIGVADSPGGHRVDGASPWLVVDDHRPGSLRPAVSPSTQFYQGIYRTKIIPLPVLPVSWPTPSYANRPVTNDLAKTGAKGAGLAARQ